MIFERDEISWQRAVFFGYASTNARNYEPSLWL